MPPSLIHQAEEVKFTLRPPPYTYLHLSVHSAHDNQGETTKSSYPQVSTSNSKLDAITLLTHLTSALRSYLGLSGTAIPVDILHINGSIREAWVRVPREDGPKLRGALAQWTGRNGEMVRVERMGCWLGGLGISRGNLGQGDKGG